MSSMPDNSANRIDRANRYKSATEEYQKNLQRLQRQYKTGAIGAYDYTISSNKNELEYKKIVEKINKEIRKEKGSK